MKNLLAVLALLLLGTTAKADSFIATFTCATTCEGMELVVPMVQDANNVFQGTQTWDTLATTFPLPPNWATGEFSWAGFIDTTAGSAIRFETFRIESTIFSGTTFYDVEHYGLCPTPEACQRGFEYGTVVFTDPPTGAPEPATLVLLIVGLFVIALRAK